MFNLPRPFSASMLRGSQGVVTVTAQEVRENGWLIIFGKVYSVKEQLLPRKKHHFF